MGVSPCYYIGVAQGLGAQFFSEEDAEETFGDSSAAIVNELSPCVTVVTQLFETMSYFAPDLKSGKIFDAFVYDITHIVGNLGAVTETCNFS